MKKKKAKGKLTVSLSELSQEINLKDYLGRKPTAKEKQLFADLAVDTIVNRTLDGQTVNGGKFKKYSKDYAALKGVTRDSVDLFLEGDLLESIGRRSSKEKVNTVKIQMKKGLQTKKGFNHQTGDTLPKREFFAVTDQEAKSITEEIRDKKADKEKVKTSNILSTRESVTSAGVSLAELRAALDLLDIDQIE